MSTNFGTITLMGSGELTNSMVKVHRNLLARTGEAPKPVFLDTPAGFELNADEISARAVAYFKQYLDAELRVASFKSRHAASPLALEDALNNLRHANYIFAGPGSPSYAVSHWRDTPLWEMVVKRWQGGAHLVFASAAAISVGRLTIPVYEIFKAGHDVCWMNGLDLFATCGLNLAIVPHWNNAEGHTFDTRFCFMGMPRLALLEQQLDPGIAILGIDEHTAITFDSATKSCVIVGAGQVTLRYGGREQYFASGTTVEFDQLRVSNLPSMLGESVTAADQPMPSPEMQATTQYLEHLTRAMQVGGSGPQDHRELIDHAHATMHELAEGWRQADSLLPDSTPAELMQVVVLTRNRLRAAKQFALADELRDELEKIGILLQDTPAGTSWKSLDGKRPPTQP